jgi:hypothetical protein
VTYSYVKYETAIDEKPASQKPNNVSMCEYTKALQENRHDLKLVARFEIDRANRKVDRAANQRALESKKQRQNFSVLDQGPSHGPGYQRPHTMIYSKGLKDGSQHDSNMSSVASLSNHPKQFNRRRTENTIYAQDYLKTWNKIQKFQPILETTKFATASANNSILFNSTVHVAKKPVGKDNKSYHTRQTTISTNETLTQNSTSRISATFHSRLPTSRPASSLSFLNMTDNDVSRSQITSRTAKTAKSASSAYMKQTRASKSKQVIR